jgi:tight adherence protein C
MTLILGLVFASVFSLALTCLALRPDRSDLHRRLTPPLERAARKRGTPRAAERVVAMVAQLGGDPRRRPERGDRGIRRRLVQAGLRGRSALPFYLGSRLLCGAGAAGAALLLPPVLTLSTGGLWLLLVAAAGLGFVLPGLLVDALRRRRQRLVRRGLPDAIDLLIVCLEAGLSLRAALYRVAADFELTHPVLAEEFKRVVLETQAGKSHAEALRALSARTGLPEVSSFVAMLIQTDRFGTDLAETFRVHSESMRSERLLAAEEVAQKAPVKMLVPAALFIFPATLIVTVGPGILQILEALQ